MSPVTTSNYNGMIHLLIIDALNVIRRLYAVQEKHAADPAAILPALEQAVVRVTRTVVQEHQPTHAIAVFDSEQPGWRHALYPDYKGGRTPMPDALRQHLDALQDSFARCGLDSLLSTTDEADDLIATLIQPVISNQHRVTLISTDKGFCQLLAPGLQIRDYFNKRWLDADFIHQKYGITPAQLVDFWTLTGISGVNIRGVPQIGEKTAQKLLADWGTLDAMLEAPADPKLKALTLVQQHREHCQHIRPLIQLKCDIPLGFNLKDLRLNTQSTAT